MLGEGLWTSTQTAVWQWPLGGPHLSWYNCHYPENLVYASACAGVAFGMGSSSGQKDSPSASICVADRNLSLQAVSPADHPELPVLGEMCFLMKKILNFYPWS